MIHGRKISSLPVVSIVVPFWVYLIGSLLYIWGLNQKKELQWRLQVVSGFDCQAKESKEFSQPQPRVWKAWGCCCF